MRLDGRIHARPGSHIGAFGESVEGLLQDAKLIQIPRFSRLLLFLESALGLWSGGVWVPEEFSRAPPLLDEH